MPVNIVTQRLKGVNQNHQVLNMTNIENILKNIETLKSIESFQRKKICWYCYQLF